VAGKAGEFIVARTLQGELRLPDQLLRVIGNARTLRDIEKE